MDENMFEEVMAHVAKVHSHGLTECPCGGQLNFCMQALKTGPDGYYDEMSYQCDTCKEIYRRNFPVPYMKGMKDDEISKNLGEVQGEESGGEEAEKGGD